MKRIPIFLAAALLTAALAGCGSRQAEDKKDGLDNPASSDVSSVAPESPADTPSDSGPADGEDGSVYSLIQDAQLKAACQAVQNEFGEPWLAMPGAVSAEQLAEIYYVDPEDVEEFAGEMSMANVSGDTFIAVKAKPGRAAAVAEALEKRRQDIISQFETYPVNFMDVKSQAAKVVTEGDYVFLLLMGDLDVPDGEEATLEMAEAEIERAEKALRSALGK